MKPDSYCACLAGLALSLAASAVAGADMATLEYNNPGLVVDLGVGLWAMPLPTDYDGDGDNDLLVVSSGKPTNGTYFFENVDGPKVKMPNFKAGVRIDKALLNIQPSYVDGRMRILRAGEEFVDFARNKLDKRVKLPIQTEDIHTTKGRIRANHWRYLDYDGDGVQDLIVGIGDWTDYGWDDAFDSTGKWTNGPLHGFVYFVRNTGTNEKPEYVAAAKVGAGGQPIDVFGMPSPSFADYDGDGDLDLVCGEFVDRLTYFENTGTRTDPRYAAGRPVTAGGQPVRMHACMINVVAYDWDSDGDPDLIVGQEDGRVALVENTGKKGPDGQPDFTMPQFFKQVADDVKFGVLVDPVANDWDGDGDQDLICGNAAGEIGFIENLGGGEKPKWAPPRLLEADGKQIRIMAGENGSIQGPAEAKWGYTTLSVADWDQDGLDDIIVNSIWGKVVWYRNIGTRTAPKLAAERPVEVEWPGPAPKPQWHWWNPSGKQLVTQWRTTPVAIDATGDGLTDLVMLDRDGYLSLFERKRDNGKLLLMPPRHVFHVEPGAASVLDHNNKPVTHDANKDGTNDLAAPDPSGKLISYTMNPMGARDLVFTKISDRKGDPAYTFSAEDETALRLTGGWAGRSGRRKIWLADWDRDGKLDLLVNSINVTLFRNVASEPGKFVFRNEGPLHEMVLAGHDTSPSVCDFDGNGIPDLMIGSEDGNIYFLPNFRTDDWPGLTDQRR